MTLRTPNLEWVFTSTGDGRFPRSPPERAGEREGGRDRLRQIFIERVGESEIVA